MIGLCKGCHIAWLEDEQEEGKCPHCEANLLICDTDEEILRMLLTLTREARDKMERRPAKPREKEASYSEAFGICLVLLDNVHQTLLARFEG